MNMPSSHSGYLVRAALFLSTSKTIVRDWQDYHLEIIQHDEQHYTFTAALTGHDPHIREELTNGRHLSDFLQERSLPIGGWLPEEIANQAIALVID